MEPKRARMLILGSLPGVESIRRGEYYAHPRNVFWPIMGELFGAGRDQPYARRLRILSAQGVLLWDVLHAARRPGSLDAAIHPRELVPNDLPGLRARHPELALIAFNGGAAEALFRKHVLRVASEPFAGVAQVRLPSTSPAHAARSFTQKLAAWHRALAGRSGDLMLKGAARSPEWTSSS